MHDLDAAKSTLRPRLLKFVEEAERHWTLAGWVVLEFGP